MTAPVRIQLSRKKGFDLQAHSRAVNGTAAVSVARPTRWGNPFKVAPAEEAGGVRIPEITAEAAVDLFRARMLADMERWPTLRTMIDVRLRGKNLACWCKPGDPCHADVLLALANGETTDG